MKKSFILHTDVYEHIENLSEKDKATLLDAMFKHASGEEINLTGIVGMAFSFIKSQIDRDTEKWERRAEASRSNGIKGGRPPKPKKPVGSVANLDNLQQPSEPVTVNATVTAKEEDKNITKVIQKKPNTKGTRWKREYATMEFVEYAMKQHGWKQNDTVDVLEEFEDHWLATAGAKGVKLDWLATWRTWCRNKIKFDGERNERFKN